MTGYRVKALSKLIEADCLKGFDGVTQRTSKENCNTLKFDLSEFKKGIQ
ncbi:MAG: hypothetical protein LHW56_05015 [Candidatus Cloacimonetes bacterium]|nr:hypothetical protein [Candidatus Cloacimonadota bacterium]MDY0172250.1 hypothetical protein [Candidatus Cloacimonadaceae bacterium]